MRYRSAVLVAATVLCAVDTARALQVALPLAPAEASAPGHEKSPALARVIGIVPGAGHVYAGEPAHGLIYLGATLGATIIAYNAPYECSQDPWTGEEYCSETLVGTVSMLTMLGVWGWSIFDAGRAARRTNARRIRVTGMRVERAHLVDAMRTTRVGIGVQWTPGSR